MERAVGGGEGGVLRDMVEMEGIEERGSERGSAKSSDKGSDARGLERGSESGSMNESFLEIGFGVTLLGDEFSVVALGSSSDKVAVLSTCWTVRRG